jgi:hypothetical protein
MTCLLAVLPLAFLFETWWSAAAVAGGVVSIPIIIHLLNRRRFKVVQWAAMRFLLSAQKKNTRKLRLEQLLLLLCRCLIVTLLALAMISVTPWAEAGWRWAFPGAVAGVQVSSVRTHKIIVIDGSFSMDLKIPKDKGGNAETTCFARALEMARKIVADKAGGNAYSVVLMANPPRRIVGEPSEDSRKVLAEIDKLRLPHGTADVAATLNTVESLLSLSPGKFHAREVYFITDMQASQWLVPQPTTLTTVLEKIRNAGKGHNSLYFVNVGGEAVSNTAVTNLTIADEMATTGRLTTILATLHNYGTDTGEKIVKLLVGKVGKETVDGAMRMDEAQTSLVKIERNADTPVAFAYKFPAPGDYALQVQVAGDKLALDDTRTVVVTVKKDIPVLLVNGKPAGDPFDQATEWVRLSLNPFDDRVDSGALFKPTVLTPTKWADETSGDVTPYDCVFLCDLPSVTLLEAKRLERHIRRGGGLVICLGPQVQPGEYNRTMYRQENNPVPALLPASIVSLQKIEGDAPFQFRFALEGDSDRVPPINAFRAANDQASLLTPRFRSFFQTREVGNAPKGRHVLSFEPEVIPGKEKLAGNFQRPPGGPAILEWNPPSTETRKAGDPPLPTRLRGKSILITTAVNAQWGNWPASPSFPALINELALFASAGRLREQSIEVGQALELFLGTPDGGTEGNILTPDGRTETARTINLDEASVLRYFDTDVSGLYRVTLGNQKKEYPFAVNVPTGGEPATSESNLTRATEEEMAKVYGEIKIATDPDSLVRDAIEGTEIEVIERSLGPLIAQWLLLVCFVLILCEVLLAWLFGHYTSVALLEEPKTPRPAWQTWALRVLPVVLIGLVVVVAGVLLHDAFTGDFLGFLPGFMRQGVEAMSGVPAPATGEESHWRLQYLSYLGYGGNADAWIGFAIGFAALALVWSVYRKEGRGVTLGQQLLLTTLRLGIILLMLAVFLPQLRLWFERQGWPDVVVLIDDSESMSAVDRYRDTRVKEAADTLLKNANLTEGDRLKLAQLLLTQKSPDWLGNLMQQKKVRLHVYHCSIRAHRIKEAITPLELEGVRTAIKELRAEPANDSSQLGAAVRQVINDFRGSSLSAIVMLTDGVTTEGEDLVKVANYARQSQVPLFFIGLGDAHDVRDVALQDLQVEDSCYVNDRLVFEMQLAVSGYEAMQVPVYLYEKGKEDGEPLDKQQVATDGSGKKVKVRLTHVPKTPGEKIFVVKTPVLPDEVDKDNNRLERPVSVRETKLIKVLYAEGYRRYEYHFVKTLLERESNRIKGNKTIDLKVWLQEADPGHAGQDASAINDLPTRKELELFDVVILGDVDPKNPRDPQRMEEFLKSLADFVREKGGGLLVVAGERYTPRAYRDTPLRDILPIELQANVKPQDVDVAILDSYRPELTPTGRVHPIFRFSPDERDNDEIWAHLKEMYFYADGYTQKRAAEVLATHPKVKVDDKEGAQKLPLVLQQFVGAGRCMFFGFHETWRWGHREDQGKFNQFWVQTVRYLSRSRLGRIDLRLDRQTNYRRGEPIKVLVRFPDDAPPPPEGTEVKVMVERRLPGKGEAQTRTLTLSKVEGSRASFEAVLTQTPEGEYSFWLTLPAVPEPRPHAECKVVAPPGEMYGLRQNQAELEQAADQSGGKYFSLADADKVVASLPDGNRVTLSSTGPPWLLWTYPLLFLLAILLFTTEWLWRKRLSLL